MQFASENRGLVDITLLVEVEDFDLIFVDNNGKRHTCQRGNDVQFGPLHLG